jgi:glycine hydroxymethyltransferase
MMPSGSRTDGSSPLDVVKNLSRIIEEHDYWYTRESICLNAAEAVVSPLAQKALSSYLINRAAAGSIGKRSHTGLEHIEQLDAVLVSVAKRLFGCDFVEYRALSAAVANGWALRLLTEVGDSVLALAIGHATYRGKGYAGMRGLKVHDLPVDEHFNVDVSVYEQLVKSIRPKAVLIGQSQFLFPYPLKEMAEIARNYGTRIMYDAAHVMGLIAGKQFQQPLQEGAYVVTSSTAKSLGASLGGLILYDDPELDRKNSEIWSGHVAGRNSGTLASLAIMLAEHLEFGEALYAQVVRNAQALGQALNDAGFDVFGKDLGYTRSHTILVDCAKLGDHRALAARMRQANIIFSPFSLPKYGAHGSSGFRLATVPCTAYGMREPQMQYIAECFRRVLLQSEDPSRVAREVRELRAQFSTRQYCFGAQALLG